MFTRPPYSLHCTMIKAIQMLTDHFRGAENCGTAQTCEKEDCTCVQFLPTFIILTKHLEDMSPMTVGWTYTYRTFPAWRC
jgi:hypothetical protein